MKRQILGILLGLIIGVITIIAVEYISHIVYPAPSDLDFTNPEQMKKFVNELPLGAFLFILLAWSLGVGLGSFIATTITRKPVMSATIIGALLMLGAIINMLMIPHPMWFFICGVLVFPLFAFMGSLIAKKKFAENKGC